MKPWKLGKILVKKKLGTAAERAVRRSWDKDEAGEEDQKKKKKLGKKEKLGKGVPWRQAPAARSAFINVRRSQPPR